MGQAGNCTAPVRPTAPNTTLAFTRLGGPAGPGAPVVPTVTPEQAAYMAVAQLQLPANEPGIGPAPAKNEWHMAVVGYPLWLWADGATHVGPVNQAVANLSVSLDAKISKTVFSMGGRQPGHLRRSREAVRKLGPARRRVAELRLQLHQAQPARRQIHGHRDHHLGRHLDGERGHRRDRCTASGVGATAGRRAPGRDRPLRSSWEPA